MKTKQKPLSEKIIGRTNTYKNVIHTEDVTEAVRRLKEINCKYAKDNMLWSSLNQEVDKIFGDLKTKDVRR